MIKQSKYFNQHGMTLVEILMALAIGSILIGAMAQLNIFVARMTNQQFNIIGGHANSIVTLTALRQDLTSSAPSLNALSLKDDAGYNFFDFDPDYDCDCSNPTNSNPAKLLGDAVLYPLKSGDPLTPEGCTRTLTLTLSTPVPAPSSSPLPSALPAPLTEIDILVASSPLMLYQPADAYDVSNAFKGLDYNKTMENSANLKQVWQKNAMLLLTGPAALTPPVGSPSVPKRPGYFLGYVNQPGSVTQADETATFDPVGSIFSAATLQTKYPGAVSGGSVNLGNADTYFRYLPPVGGARTFSYIQSVRLVQYRVEKVVKPAMINGQMESNHQVNHLIRAQWLPDQSPPGFGASVVLGEGFDVLQFKRPCISTPVIQYIYK